jgi:xanthine dehydrogenase YagR molybdenum-binding subunit
MSDQPLPKLVGTSVSRVDGRAKVTGKADYTSDYHFPNMVWAFMVKSATAKGQLTSLDTSAAEKSPGVVKVYTAQNRPKMYPPKGQESGAGISSEQLPPLDGSEIHYDGQDVAYVIAETYEQARLGASLVKASYSGEKPVTTRETATAKAPPKVDGLAPHLEKKAPGVKDVETAWNDAPVKVDVTYVTPVIHHHPMEPHAVVAKWDDDRLTFYTPTQWMYGSRNFLAHCLAIPADHVRVISHYLGGGFGCKGSSWMYMLMVATAARDLKRPVKFVMERENMFTSNGYRPMTTQHLQLAAQKDGQLEAMRHFSETSASFVGQFVEGTGHASSYVLYKSPNIEIDHKIYDLNLSAPTFMRAPGESPGIYALESALDELAVQLSMDPVELRMKNNTQDHPFTNLPFSSRNLEEAYKVGAEKFGWAQRKAEPGSTTDGDWLVGWGMATASYPAHRSPAKCRVRILADGTADVQIAAQDLGTGTYTILAQEAADQLSLPLEKVRVQIGDSTFPEAPVSGGSQSAASIMPAVQGASRGVLALLSQLAISDAKSLLKDVQPEDIVAIDGSLQAKSDPTKTESFSAILNRAGKGALEANESVDPANEKKQKKEQETIANVFSPSTTEYQSFGAFFVEVKVHKLTCEARVSRVVTAMDIGQPLNLKTARSQVIGGTVFGIGAALMEHSILDTEQGRWITHDLGTYHLPVNKDVPDIDVSFVGPPDYKFNSLGARGIGEIGNTGMAAAIGNAVYHATGVRVRELPITPDKILMGMAAQSPARAV